MKKLINNLPLIFLVIFVLNLMTNNFLYYFIEKETHETLVNTSYLMFGLTLLTTIIKKVTTEKKPKPKKVQTSKCNSCGKKKKK